MTRKDEKPRLDEAELDLEAVREVEAALSRLIDRFAQRDSRVAAELQREMHTLRELLAGGHPQTGGGLRGSLHRLRGLYESVLVAGLNEESKDASLLMLLNRLLGV
jgi:hypothetical protein